MKYLVLLIALLPLLPVVGSTQGRPDIVIIVTDDMRSSVWDVLPATRRLRNWTVLANLIYPTPLCCPSRTTLNRGQYAHNHGVLTNGTGDFEAVQSETVATALDDVGYYTINAGKFVGGTGTDVPGWDDWANSGHALIPHQTDRIAARVVDALSTAPQGKPWLLWVGFRDPHAPYDPAPRYANADVSPVVNAEDRERRRELLATDDAIAAIAEAMGPRWDRACVIVMSDNGWMLGEHGVHGKSIWWDASVRIRARIACPGIEPGSDLRLASTVDIVPTILVAAGAIVSYPLDGRPLQQRWDREATLIESWDPANNGEPRRPFTGLKGKGWVYVEADGLGPQYYEDRAEEVNRWDELSPTRQQELRQDLDRMRACAGEEC